MDLHVYHHVVSSADVRTAIEQLTHHVDRWGGKLMAQIDDLKQTLTDVSTAVDGVATEVADLIAKLANLPPSPDLTPIQAQAQGILDRLKAIPPEPA